MEVIDPYERDSHDLSLAATRFSVVDSMLMSLSGLSNSPPSNRLHDSRLRYPDPDLDDLYAASPKRGTGSNTGRRRGHTQSSSLDEYELHVDDVASRYTAYHNRTRVDGAAIRPRKSSRADSASIPNGVVARPPVDVFDDGAAIDKENMPRHARGTGVKGSKGSKGSGSSSVDLGPSYAFRGGLAHGPHRAASFGHGRGARASPPKLQPPPPLEKVRSQPAFDYTGFDAAPTPTIPAGPRRLQEPLSPPPLVSPPPLTPKKTAPSRRNSIRSANGKVTKRDKSQALDPAIRDQARQFVQASNQLRSVHAGPAPSPTVGGPRRQHMIVPAPNPPKERPGFFRRIFGSSKEKEEERRPPSPPLIPQAPGSGHRPKTQPTSQHIATQLKPASRPSTQDAPSGSRDGQQYPTLKKTHSSFFRWRKKSISESMPPPVPPLHLPPKQPQREERVTPVLSAQPSSPDLNSLRKAMDPFLHGANISPAEAYFVGRERQGSVDEAALAANRGRGPAGSRLSTSILLARPSVPDLPGNLDREASGDLLDRERGADALHHLPTDDVAAPTAAAAQILQAMKRGRFGLVGDVESSFLHDSSGGDDVGTSSSDASPPAADQRLPVSRSLPAPTSDPYSQLPFHAAPPVPPRKANIDEKRLESPSPISDRSHLIAEPGASAQRPPANSDDGDEFVVSSRKDDSLNSQSNNRVWLEPSSSEEKLTGKTSLSLPLEGPRVAEKPPALTPRSPGSENDVFASAPSSPLIRQESNGDTSNDFPDTDAAKAILDNDVDITPADRERARQIFDGEETFVTKNEAAAWLGQTSPKSTRTRRAYMELYDLNGSNILAAFRELCSKLVVKAESQQLDRVIDAFSERWCACNPNHGFKDRDVVHTITYSLLMLNTDLHVADQEQRMTRSQFVKNTLPTIRDIADAAALAANSNPDRVPSRLDQPKTNCWDQASSPSSPIFPPESRNSEDIRERSSLETKLTKNRISRAPARQDSDGPLDSAPGDSCNVLVKAPYDGGMKGWEFQVEIVLKEYYNSIRQQRLPLRGVPEHNRVVTEQPSTVSLSVVSGLRRTPSVLSKAPSDNISYRGRSSEFKPSGGRFGLKNRSRPRIYPTSTVGSSRTSLDDQSVFSPTGSAWSKYSLGKTQTSVSVDSLGSHYGQGDYQQAIGFANALSQAIIREESGKLDSASEEGTSRTAPLLEDETLELAGPPWAKEGIVKHRHHLETLEKKAKERGWSESFAVIEKGWMRLFSFNQPSKSLRHRIRGRSMSGSSHAGGVVGGGNWTENAEALGSFLLRQTIASALPPPGYSKTRPHVFALSLPTGAVHLFSVGTAEIVKEFVSTANYWSARLSKEPLIGGVSNIEYGWSDAIIAAVATAPRSASQGEDGTAAGSVSFATLPRASIAGPLQSQVINHSATPSHSSISRGSLDQSLASPRSRLPGDRIQISEWQPPTQSMMASNLMEVDQLRALTAYVQKVEEELRKHNELRPVMGLAFSPRHPNATKAMANWEKKSAYLLREIVKFRTYIDSLTAAQQGKDKIYKERAEKEKAMEAKGNNNNAPVATNGIGGTNGVHFDQPPSDGSKASTQLEPPPIQTERPSFEDNDDGAHTSDVDEATIEAIAIRKKRDTLRRPSAPELRGG